MLDGLGKIPKYAQAASERGISHLAITDHGSLGGVYEHYKACLAAGVEPVLGEEFYFVPSVEESRQFKSNKRYHITVLARGEQGYRILKELHDEAHRNFYYKPLIDRSIMESLGDATKHLWVLSGCAGSILSQRALEASSGGSREAIRAVAVELAWWTKVFPNFAMELMSHKNEIDKPLNASLVSLAGKLKLPMVATNDCHYVDEGDADTHDALLAIQTAADIDDPNRFRFDGEGYFLRSRAELRRAFAGVVTEEVWKQAVRGSLSIARDCSTRIPAWDQRTWHIPKFPGVDDAYRRVVKLTRRGLADRGLSDDRRYVVRAKSELRKIKETGISDFLLICREQNEWAASKGIRVGYGRGSVASSLVAYLIGIHKVDSVRYDLKFERFLNPERPKMPDVDTDFQPSRREEIFAHLADVYGSDNVMRVAAFQTMKVAGAFRKLATAHGMEYLKINEVAKVLNPVGGHPDDDAGDEADEDISVLPREVREEYPGLSAQIEQIMGTKSALSSHAAGMIIFAPNDPVKELIPQQWLTGPKHLAGAFDLKSTEKIGLMKMDELGLRTLDTIQKCVDLLSMKGIEVEPDEWIPDEEVDDSKVYRMLRQGKTAGVFQMEGGTNARGIMEVRCNCFEDIVACTSLYRAGPLGVGADKRYVANKRNGTVLVVDEVLRPILKNSWGEMIYQEQMMEICHEVAGFTWIETDDVKEAVRFKDAEIMAAFKDRFIVGCQTTSGISPDVSSQIWAMIESQSSYLFNRAHAVAYSITTYQTARLKCLYPHEYMAAYLGTVPPKTDSAKERRRKIMAEAYELGFQILPPDINLSCEVVMPECGERPGLRFGFGDLKGIGEKSAIKIVVARNKEQGFKTATQVADVVDKRSLGVLAGSGALASVGGPKASLSEIEEYVDWQFTDNMRQYRRKLKNQVKFPKGNNSYCAIVGEIVGFEKRKTKTNKPFRVMTLKWSPAEMFVCSLWSETQSAWPRLTLGSIVAVEGNYSRDWNNISVGDAENINLLKEK